jgi:RND family efflux transporter MFP subunit
MQKNLYLLAGLIYVLNVNAEAPEFAYKKKDVAVPEAIATETKPEEAAAKLETTVVQDQTAMMGKNQLLRAQIKARESSQIASERNGRINLLKLHDGDRFKAGQVLVGFDCALEEAQLSKAKATLDKKTKTYVVNQKLEKLKSISTLELDVAKAEEDEAMADVKVVEATLSKCNIKAPFSGRVSEVTARPYQSVREGDPLMEIINEKNLEVEFMAPSKALPELDIGRAFRVTLDETATTHSGEIVRLGGKVDPVSQTIKVYGRITDGISELLPGMSGAVELMPIE